ncbi:Protein CBG08549 [Caenorhabditis briggsae]|uniref:Protein CBG08549 n=1 Tax=Caenorhabditis briggsae TaxID=6238 RepID=A8X755_CAEBR|nr:Protein CBG08549 [Caenorhabditis briggsae]CAP28466.2 Protein CBG08549 [Caenorhabditis briggsae]
MKYLFSFFVLSTFVIISMAQFDDIKPCVICDDHWFLVPTSWENMSKYLRGRCNRLDKEIIWPCRDLVDSMDLWEQYSTLYPYIVELHKQACKVFCFFSIWRSD